MSEVFYTSDTHFNHLFVAALRGFGTITYDEMGKRTVEADIEVYNQHLISTWNKYVSPADTVWHTGDFALGTWEQTEAVIPQLNGTIHLITGNHDRCWPGNRDGYKWQRKYLEYFETVQQYARRKIDGQLVFLSHFPYEGDHKSESRPEGEDRHTQYRLRNEGQWLLHGHTHQSHIMTGLHEIHVGWDTWKRPVSQDEIAEVIKRELQIRS
jgi:calcineurin-like phosphoesterase family protein